MTDVSRILGSGVSGRARGFGPKTGVVRWGRESPWRAPRGARIRIVAALLVGALLSGCGSQQPPGNAGTGGEQSVPQPASTNRATGADPYAEAVAYQQSGDFTGALKKYTEAIKADPKRFDALVGRAHVYKGLGQLDRALADYDAAIRLAPDNARLYMHRAVFRQVRGRLGLAIKDCNQALQLDPGGLPGAYSFRANLYIALGDFRRAVQDCDEALRLKPNLHTAYINRGVAQERLGELDLAVADYTRSIELAPQSAISYRNRGVVHMRRGDLDKAIDDFTQAIQLNPNDVMPYDSRGSAYLKRGEAEKAIADFTRVIHLVDHSSRRSSGGLRPGKKAAQVYARRAEAHRRLSNREQASADCQRALEIDSTCSLARSVRAKLASDRPPHALPENSGR